MTDNKLQFRIATLEDAPQVQQLVQSAFRAEDSRPDWTSDMDLSLRFTMKLEDVIAQISKPHGDILIAVQDDAIVGSVEVSKRNEDEGRVSMLAVDQSRQRGGLGRELLGHAEEYCVRIWAVKKLSLGALSSRQELIKWYMRRGYHKTGVTTPFPRDLFKDLTLADDLCFIELEKPVDETINT
jgi:ribosomal protein S18 acetylase RimI-like enzyme